MIAQNEDRIDVGLPEGLRRQFTLLERRLWVVETLAAVCGAWGGALLSYLIQFLSDRIWDTPSAVRGVITLAGVAGLSWAAIGWSRVWVWRRRDTLALANLVQAKYRRLGDRLLGIVELADNQERPSNFSPALYRAAIQQVTAQALEYDFTAAVNSRPARRAALALAVGLALVAVAGLAVPSAAANAFRRWVAPLAAIPRYTLVNLGGLRPQMIVAAGESFEVTGAVSFNSFWKPAHAFAQFDRQPMLEARIELGRAHFQVPAQVQPGALKIWAGDASQTVRIVPSRRPSLRELAASIELPSYLQYPPAREIVQNGALALVEGSKVSFQGQVSTNLASAEMQLPGRGPEPLKVEGDHFMTASIFGDALSQCVFKWRDAQGLEVAAPWTLLVQSHADAPPTPELVDQPQETSVLNSEMLQLKAAAKDDFGVKELGLHWNVIAEGPQTNAIAREEFKIEAETPRQKELTETFLFSPALLRIPDDTTIEFRAYATDYLPGRAPAESAVYRVLVVSNERHAELVRLRMESLLVRLEEVTRAEEKIANGTTGVLELPKEKQANDETAQRLGELAADQLRNADALAQMSREGMKTLREAMRNPAFPTDTLKEWTKNLSQMQSLSNGKMQKAAKSLKAGQQNPSSRPQETSDAETAEKEALEALQKMQQTVNHDLDQLQALTLAQRLRKLAGDEKDLAGRLQKNVAETIGLTPEELPANYQKANQNVAHDQDGARGESQVLQGEISRFFERTQQKNYGYVSKEMNESHAAEELERVRGLIQNNIAMEAVKNLGGWNKRFNEWAERLDPKPDPSKSDGDAKDGAPSEELMKELIALVRLRERELKVRAQSRLAEQGKQDAPTYVERAAALATEEAKVKGDLGDVMKDNTISLLEPPLQDAQQAIGQAESLLRKPQTDQVTDAAAGKSIDSLSDAINLLNEQSKAGSGSKSGQSSEAMEFLMQMVAQQPGQQPGMSPGSSPGGNRNGGTTSAPATPLNGAAVGKADESRKNSGSSGQTRNVPAEFREALENYFKAIEQ